jgi:hypothetical protein
MKRYLIRLRGKGRRKAVLTLPGGVLFSDRDDVDAALRQAFNDGWKSADIESLYPDEDGKTATKLVEYSGPPAP